MRSDFCGEVGVNLAVIDVIGQFMEGTNGWFKSTWKYRVMEAIRIFKVGSALRAF